ncbi:PREDICTED: transcription repressor OFP18-like [Camelina sativa]|uniref:Transcription repressor n=1 Tax=Camelina sativa TaxID=90675 RepID=A0ABM0TIF0_CAMSA|nr:PREDICTED: transcription repressor OFP18-like [Camelina sativa]
MVRKMKLPFLNKNNMTSSSSFSSSSSSSSSSWPWPSCHQQNPKTTSSRASVTVNKPKHVDESEPPPRSFSSSSSYSSYSSFSSTSHVMENPPEIESIENVIRGLKSSKRLIFEQRGTSNSILDCATKREDHDDEEEGFMLLSLETNDPYSDFKNSMEKMVEAHALHHDWKSLEKLLFWFLKVNAKTSHRYIFAAFVDLVLNFVVVPSKDIAGEPSSDVGVEDVLSSSWPISLYTSYSSSDETSSTSVRLLPETSRGEKSRGVCCLSSLFELEEKINPNG